MDAGFIGSYGEDGFFYIGAVLEYENGVATYEEESFGDVSKINMKIEGDSVVVEASSTDTESTYQYISGTYLFKEEKVWDFEECKKQADEIEISEDGFIY